MTRTCLVILFLTFMHLVAMPVCGEVITGRASFDSWSGHWWPKKKGELARGYLGNPSPLEKYDFYATGAFPGAATKWALKPANNIYDPAALSWTGLCHAWANAAVLEDIDFVPSSLGGVFWRVSDKKGLLTLAHSDDIKYDHAWLADPAKLHRFLLEYLGGQGLGLGIDLDPGEEFWSHPVYRFEMEVSSSPGADAVICTIYYADYASVYSDTVSTIERSKTYTYRLDKDSSGRYVGGVWTGSSVGDHPGYVWVPITQNTHCPHLEYDLVREIALSRGDPLDGQPAQPGHHCLVVYPGEEDLIPIDVPDGTSSLSLGLSYDVRSPGSGADYELTRDGEVISSGSVPSSLNTITLDEPASGPYLLRVSPVNSSAAVSVNLYLDLDLTSTALIPVYPATADWLGLALASQDGSGGVNRVYATIMADNGLPLSLAAPGIDLAGMSKWSGLVPLDQRMDISSGGRPGALKITSQRDLDIVHLASSRGLLLGAQGISIPARSGDKVIPALTGMFNSRQSADLHLGNTAGHEAGVETTLFLDTGQTWLKSTLLGPKEVVGYTPGSYFGSTNVQGWGLVQDPEGVLAGMVALVEESVRGDALPLLFPGTSFDLPHLVRDGYWQTRLALYNPSGEWLDVTLCFNNTEQELNSVISLEPWSRKELVLGPNRWGLSTAEMNSGWLSLQADRPFAGWFGYQGGSETLALLPLLDREDAASAKRLCHVASDQTWWTGLSLVNPGKSQTLVTLVGYNRHGEEAGRTSRTLEPGQKLAVLISQLFPGQGIESLELLSDSPVHGFALYGSPQDNGLLAAHAM